MCVICIYFIKSGRNSVPHRMAALPKRLSFVYFAAIQTSIAPIPASSPNLATWEAPHHLTHVRKLLACCLFKICVAPSFVALIFIPWMFFYFSCSETRPGFLSFWSPLSLPGWRWFSQSVGQLCQAENFWTVAFCFLSKQLWPQTSPSSAANSLPGGITAALSAGRKAWGEPRSLGARRGCWLWCRKVRVLQGCVLGQALAVCSFLILPPAPGLWVGLRARWHCAAVLQKSWLLFSHNQFVVLIIKCCFMVLK